MCVGCRKRRDKGEMIRFTLSTDGRAHVTKGNNGNGRGFYLCPDPACLAAAKKKRRLDPAVRIDYGSKD
jgi:hypothetical protein